MTGGLRGYRADVAFDGERELPGGALVLVEGDLIVGVEPGTAPAPDGCEVSYIQGTTLLPGLIDAHVHLCADSGPRALEQLPELTAGELDEDHHQLPCGAVARLGVTAVRDLGDIGWAAVHRRGHRCRRAARGCVRTADHEPSVVIARTWAGRRGRPGDGACDRRTGSRRARRRRREDHDQWRRDDDHHRCHGVLSSGACRGTGCGRGSTPARPTCDRARTRPERPWRCPSRQVSTASSTARALSPGWAAHPTGTRRANRRGWDVGLSDAREESSGGAAATDQGRSWRAPG